MPRARGGASVRRNMGRTIARIRGPVTERVMQEIMIIGEAEAVSLTPVDTSNLVNSRYRQTINIPEGLRGRVGYTAKYAQFVHDASGKLKGQPREHFGKTRAGVAFGGGSGNGHYWDPDAEPHFLTKGFEQADGDIRDAIVRGYRQSGR